MLGKGRPWIALGTPGGHTITQTVARMIMNVVDFGMDIQGAIAAPRVAFVEPATLVVEEEIPPAIREKLIAAGHEVEVRDIGNAHGLTIEYYRRGEPIRFAGGADPRAGSAGGI